MRSQAAPRPEFRSALRAKLSAAYEARYPSAASSPLLKFAAAGVCVVVLFFGMGTGVYAYESPEVTPDHPLYFMKSGMEQMEGRFAKTPEARAKFHAKMMDRRLKEAERFFQKNRKVGGVLLQSAADELGMTTDELKGELRDPQTRREVLQELSEQSDRYADILSRVQETGERKFPLPEELRQKLQSLQP